MDVKYNYSDENYIKWILKFNYDHYMSLNKSKPPLNNPEKDSFEKRSEESSAPAQKESKWLTKENVIVGSAGLALAAAVAATCIMKGKGMSKTIKSLQNAVNDNQKVIDELRSKISKLTELPEDMKKAKDILVKKYKNLVNNPTLPYNPLQPIKKEVYENCAITDAKRVLNFGEINPLVRKVSSGAEEVLDTAKLKSALSSDGSVEIILPKTSKVKPVISASAKIDGQNIEELGKKIDTDFYLTYGDRTHWNEEKIARDIMQNFYDGHGNTLDGVKISVKKLPDGQFSIRVRGDATYDYKNLRFIGSGSKPQNAHNAGGYGEGAKVLVTNLLNRGDTQAVKYSCADWEYIFDSANGIMRRTLKKAQTPIEGNSIEFTTNNKKLAEAVLDSVNYFEHSKNPDFKGLHFDSKDFGFRFLEGEGAKGNIYLTQRYEFAKSGAWNNGVDDIALIFRRKPDPERFLEITGKELLPDRDRKLLTFADIEDLTKYFARDISDDDLVKILFTTKSKWLNLPKGYKDSSLGSFVKGIIEEIRRRKIAIDFSKEKLAADAYDPNNTAESTLLSYGYKILPEYFKDIGLRTKRNICDRMSIHTPLQPTQNEIKKLKLLEEGVRVIKADIDEAFSKYRENVIFRFGENIKPEDTKFINFSNDADIAKIVRKYISKDKCIFMEDMSEKTFSDMLREMEPVIIKKLKEGNCDDILDPLYKLSVANKIDKRSGQYIISYKSFSLIKDEDVIKPRFIFDRTAEKATDTLGESITDKGKYFGHWIDRGYLESSDFSNLLATWLHEISHKIGGDGTPEFTYALTDLIQVLVSPNSSKNTKIKLAALEEIFNSIGKKAAA